MIPAEQLVPGDIVLLESGDTIPADLRLIEVKNLRTEEAALTGESVPAEKSIAPVPDKATVGDRESMAFSGTHGRLRPRDGPRGRDRQRDRAWPHQPDACQCQPARDAAAAPDQEVRLQDHGRHRRVSVLIFSYGHWLGHMTFVELFQAVVGIAVSLIPEGLPALITITLAIGVQRMAQRHAIIRRLPAVETLGSVSRICSDKTGTLTLMEMMVDLRRHGGIGLRGHRRRLRARRRDPAGRQAARRGPECSR